MQEGNTFPGVDKQSEKKDDQRLLVVVDNNTLSILTALGKSVAKKFDNLVPEESNKQIIVRNSLYKRCQQDTSQISNYFLVLPYEMVMKIVFRMIPEFIGSEKRFIQVLQDITSFTQSCKTMKDNYSSNEDFLLDLFKKMAGSSILSFNSMENIVKSCRNFYDPSFRIRILPAFQKCIQHASAGRELKKRGLKKKETRGFKPLGSVIEALQHYFVPNSFLVDNNSSSVEQEEEKILGISDLPNELLYEIMGFLIPTRVSEKKYYIQTLLDISHLARINKFMYRLCSGDDFLAAEIIKRLNKKVSYELIGEIDKEIRTFRNPYDSSFRLRILPVFKEPLKEANKLSQKFKGFSEGVFKHPEEALKILAENSHLDVTKGSYRIGAVDFDKKYKFYKELIKKLVERGMDANATIVSAQFKIPLLVWAIDVSDKKLDLIEFLLEKNADPRMEYIDHDENRMTPLEYAGNDSQILALFEKYMKKN